MATEIEQLYKHLPIFKHIFASETLPQLRTMIPALAEVLKHFNKEEPSLENNTVEDRQEFEDFVMNVTKVNARLDDEAALSNWNLAYGDKVTEDVCRDLKYLKTAPANETAWKILFSNKLSLSYTPHSLLDRFHHSHP